MYTNYVTFPGAYDSTLAGEESTTVTAVAGTPTFGGLTQSWRGSNLQVLEEPLSRNRVLLTGIRDPRRIHVFALSTGPELSDKLLSAAAQAFPDRWVSGGTDVVYNTLWQYVARRADQRRETPLEVVKWHERVGNLVKEFTADQIKEIHDALYDIYGGITLGELQRGKVFNVLVTSAKALLPRALMFVKGNPPTASLRTDEQKRAKAEKYIAILDAAALHMEPLAWVYASRVLLGFSKDAGIGLSSILGIDGLTLATQTSRVGTSLIGAVRKNLSGLDEKERDAAEEVIRTLDGIVNFTGQYGTQLGTASVNDPLAGPQPAQSF